MASLYPWSSTLTTSLLLASLTLVGCAPEGSNAGFAAGATPLTVAEMRAARGGVLLTVIKPTANKTHYIDNPRFVADVHNALGNPQTKLYLYHGTSKTGHRSVATPAPSYRGHIESRFKHLGGSADLVIKYNDPESGTQQVSYVVHNQRMGGGVKLRRLWIHNVTAGSRITNVAGATAARVIDSQTYDATSTPPDTVDLILAQCRRRSPSRRTQFQLTGLDNGKLLHRIVAPSCATLASDVAADPKDLDGDGEYIEFDGNSEACMAELMAGALEVDPMAAHTHVYVVEALPQGMGGFSHSSAGGAVISEPEFSNPTLPALLVHEIAHGFGIGHRHNLPSGAADPECQASLSHEDRAVMCTNDPGLILSDAECDDLYFAINRPGLANLNP